MSRKMRQTVTMVVLCVLLIAAGVGYYALIKYQSSQEEVADQEEIPVYELEESKITSIQYKNQKEEMRLVKEKDIWKIADDKEFPLVQNKITLMVDAVATVTAQQLVNDNCDNLEEYQLNTPDLTVEVEDSEGNKQKLVIGMESFSGGGRYAYCGDSSKIYLLSTSIYSSFDYTRGEIMKTAEIPSVTEDYVTGLNITARKGKDFQVVYDEKKSPYQHMDSWTMEKPYSQPVAADADQLRTLFGNYSSLHFSGGYTYRADHAALKKCGLVHPAYRITLDYFETDEEGDGADSSAAETQKKHPKKLQLAIGKMNQEQSGYYVQIAGDDSIYLMETATVASLVEVTPLQYVYQQLYVGDLNDLQAIELKYQGKKHRITLERKKVESTKEDKGETSVGDSGYTVKKNGKDVDVQDFEAAYASLNNLPPNGEIDSKVKPKSDKALAEFTLHEKKRDVAVVIYPYDGNNFYRVKVDGVMQFVVDMRNVDNVLKLFTAI